MCLNQTFYNMEITHYQTLQYSNNTLSLWLALVDPENLARGS